MSLLGDISNPEKVATALRPVLTEAIDKLVADLASQVVPALEAALSGVLDGLEVSVSVRRREK